MVDALIFDGKIYQKIIFGDKKNDLEFDTDDFDSDFDMNPKASKSNTNDFDDFMYVATTIPSSRDPYLSDVPYHFASTH